MSRDHSGLHSFPTRRSSDLTYGSWLLRLVEGEIDRVVQQAHSLARQLMEVALLDLAGDEDRAIAHTLEPADAQTLRLPQLAHFPVAPLHQYHVIPAVGALAGIELHVGEAAQV